jgi:Sulfatase
MRLPATLSALAARITSVATRGRVRRIAGLTLTVAAALLIFVALVLPIENVKPSAFLRLPVEALIAVGLVLLLPVRVGRWVVGVGGALLGLLTIVKVFDIGFFSVLDRPFDLLGDWPFVVAGADYVRRGHGSGVQVVVLVGVILLAVAVLVLTTLAALRLSTVVRRHRTPAARTAIALGVVWVLGIAFGAPYADTAAASRLAYDHAYQVGSDIQDKSRFAALVANDPYKNVPPSQLLTALRGKNVILAYVESYGRIALEDPQIAPGVNKVLDDGYAKLQAAGFSARSAYLTSSTFAGGSWLAHSTLESGVWVNSQQRYKQYLGSGRFTLIDAFGKAGWRTVDVEPANTAPVSEGPSFDKSYDDSNMGYRGERFTFDSMPDQYTLSVLQRSELANPGHQPVMARIVMLSSHAPWHPIPQMTDWNNIGVGYGFTATPETAGENWDLLASNRSQVKADYGHTVEYSLSTLLSYVQTYGDNNTVLVFLGDHQPDTVVSGDSGNRDAPITIVAHDPTVLDRISGWGWQAGIKPRSQAPVWRMDAFRDHFLGAFGSQP